MQSKEIVLPRKLVNELLHHAQSSEKLEVCGFVGKNSADEFSCYPVDNIAETPSTRFLMAPEEHIDTMKAMRDKKETFLPFITLTQPLPPDLQPPTLSLPLIQTPAI
jgi:Predicted metal-dependent protease of the PAD1/JAB1 superfamily